ncbi:Uncharacterised protein [Chlamydia abortus]|nr:Uncharacterised protein [Chlamydia abortus]
MLTLSPIPPVECLSTTNLLRKSQEITLPECIITSVR